MTEAEPIQTGSYELPLRRTDESVSDGDGAPVTKSLSAPLLAENILWFCRLRWIVVASFLSFGVLGRSSQVMEWLGMRQPGHWPFMLAGVLVIFNVLFLAHAGGLRRLERRRRVALNVWGQIIVDLIVLTAVVHYVGSTDTFIAFAYLYHIVLACIFFSRGQSFIVTLLACVLYVALIAAERTELVAHSSIFEVAVMGEHAGFASRPAALNLLGAMGTWLVVWYLGSHLSTMVRERDNKLARTNRRLSEALAERTTHMLRTTHELKAPFAAIDANAQILKDGYCGELPDKAREAVGRISRRCRRLANEIQEMLQLANLRSTSQRLPERTQIDLAGLLHGCIRQVEALAEQRRVSFEEDIGAARTVGAEDHLKMLLQNLLLNAVMYSHEGGRVSVRLVPADEVDGPTIVISDEGIGIAAEKLPRIFEEHYRTKEGVKHNSESSGLGLAIVRDVAELQDIRIKVTSALGRGTTFEVRFPLADET